MWVSIRDKMGVAEVLIGVGADVNAVSCEVTTALFIAADYGSPDIVELLIKAGAGLDFVGQGAFGAIASKLASSIDSMLQSNPLLQHYYVEDVQTEFIVGNTPLLKACVWGYERIARLLIDAGASVNVMGSDKWTCLTEAAYRGHTGIDRLLLNAGVQVNVVSQAGHTALSLAAKYRYREIVQLLKGHGAKTPAELQDKDERYFEVQEMLTPTDQ